MSRRGAGSSALKGRESRFEHVPVGALGRPVIEAARKLLQSGLDAGQACSLFTHVAAILSKQRGGLSRDEWLDLCEELYDRAEQGEVETGLRLTAPGGAA
jgi:hypothetical protein